MGRLAKNLVFAVLIISAVSVAGLSSASDGKTDFSYCDKIQCAEKNFVDTPADNNSEFWSKFRESVMPDDSRKDKSPNYEKNPPPTKNMPPPPRPR